MCRRVVRRSAGLCELQQPGRELSLQLTFGGTEDPMSARTTEARNGHPALAGLLTWFLPGLGHWYIGQRTRGLIFFVVIGVTFWGGVAVGGVKSSVDPETNVWWFMAQVCTGSHAVGAYSLGRRIDRMDPVPKWEPSPYRAYWPALDIAQVYTGVAGLLNLLVVFDAMARAERVSVRRLPRPPPET